jgi:ABC-type polysaccharide/polyol phosphate export permease
VVPEGVGVTAPASAPVEYRDRHTVFGDLRESIADIRGHYELLVQLTTRDIKLRYKQAVMGFAWAVFMPVLIVMAGLVVRLAMAYVSGKPLSIDGMAGVAVKALPWAFFVGAVGFASNSLLSNQALVSKVFFPREVLPLSAVLAQGFDTAVGAIALTIALPFLGATLSPALLWIVPLALLLLLLTTAICLFLACSNLFFRDVKYIVQVLLTFGIFFTPVLFDAPMLGERIAPLVMLNPLAPILEGLRLAIVEGHNLLAPLRTIEGGKLVEYWSPWLLLWSAGVGIIGLILSISMFRRLQYLFAEWV